MYSELAAYGQEFENKQSLNYLNSLQGWRSDLDLFHCEFVQSFDLPTNKFDKKQ